MSRRILSLALLSLALVALASCKKKSTSSSDPVDDNEYTIKLKKSTKGETIRTEKKENTTTKMKVTGPKSMEKQELELKKIGYTVNILERAEGEKRPTKFIITYDKYSVSKGDQSEPTSIVGKAVTAEKIGGRYRFQSAQKLSDAELKILNDKFNKPEQLDDEAMLPKKAVKINEEWTIDKEAIAKSFGDATGGMDIDLNRSSATGRLLRAYKKDDRQYGVIEIKLNMSLKEGPTKFGATIESGSKFEAVMTLDGCIDGSSHSGTMKGKSTMQFKMKGPGGLVTIEAMGEMEESESEVTK